MPLNTFGEILNLMSVVKPVSFKHATTGEHTYNPLKVSVQIGTNTSHQ
jgi:hypothetical protein